MDRMQQAEMLGKLLSGEIRISRPAKSPDTAASLSCDHWSSPVLLERVAYLHKLARFGDGTASEELKIFPGHSATLSVRQRSGIAEVDEECAQLFMVLEGRATMVTGCRIEETRTSQVAYSTTSGAGQELRAGDVVHVAARTPYQFLLAGDRTLGCLVIRIKETEEL
jgi:mannose-6-phosphate isomerase-like protein (cupin superfamily)